MGNSNPQSIPPADATAQRAVAAATARAVTLDRRAATLWFIGQQNAALRLAALAAAIRREVLTP